MATINDVCVYIVYDQSVISFDDRPGQILRDRMETTQTLCNDLRTEITLCQCNVLVGSLR